MELPKLSRLIPYVWKITPEIADQILIQFNINNRIPDQRKVDIYSQRMLDGQWIVTGGYPLVFHQDGTELLSGQHRLMAIIQSGTTQEFVCFSN